VTAARATAATLAWRLAIVGLLLVGAGLSSVLVASIQGMQLQEGLTLVDGYWIGLLPWIEVGAWLIPIGGVLAFVGAVAAIWLGRGGWVRRLATLPAVAVALFWVLLIAIETAPRHGPDGSIAHSDVATAVYSSPQNTMVFLLLPTAYVVMLAWASPRRRLEAGPAGADMA
jgi:hypothetical protein